jgi:hypothetical protein
VQAQSRSRLAPVRLRASCRDRTRGRGDHGASLDVGDVAAFQAPQCAARSGRRPVTEVARQVLDGRPLQQVSPLSALGDRRFNRSPALCGRTQPLVVALPAAHERMSSPTPPCPPRWLTGFAAAPRSRAAAKSMSARPDLRPSTPQRSPGRAQGPQRRIISRRRGWKFATGWCRGLRRRRSRGRCRAVCGSRVGRRGP